MKRDCGHEWRNNDFDCIECVDTKLRRYEAALEQIRDGLFRYNMGDYEACAKNTARMALENQSISTQLAAAAPIVNEAVTRLREFFNDDYTLIARHFKDTTKDRDITGDVEDLLNAAAADNSQLSPSARYWLTQARKSENPSNDREQAWEKLLLELVGKIEK